MLISEDETTTATDELDGSELASADDELSAVELATTTTEDAASEELSSVELTAAATDELSAAELTDDELAGESELFELPQATSDSRAEEQATRFSNKTLLMSTTLQ